MRLSEYLQVSIIFFVLIFSCCTTQKKVMTAVSSLRPRINVGDTLKYEIKVISNSKMYVNTYEFPDLQYFAKAKFYTIVTEIERDSISFKSGLIQASASLRTTEYRANTMFSKSSMRMDFWKDLEGKEWEYTLTPAGLTKSSDEKTRRFLWALFPFLPPEEPVTVGTSWEKEIERGFIVNFRFLEMKGDNAIVEFKYNTTGTEKNEDSEMKEIKFKEEAKAKVTLDTKTGKVIKININSDEERSGKIKSNRLRIYFDENWEIKVIE